MCLDRLSTANFFSQFLLVLGLISSENVFSLFSLSFLSVFAFFNVYNSRSPKTAQEFNLSFHWKGNLNMFL